MQSTLRQSLDFDEINRTYSNREEELVEAESLLNETVAAQERFLILLLYAHLMTSTTKVDSG